MDRFSVSSRLSEADLDQIWNERRMWFDESGSILSASSPSPPIPSLNFMDDPPKNVLSWTSMERRNQNLALANGKFKMSVFTNV